MTGLLARTVQEMIGVEDYDIIAAGYTISFPRKDVEIYFNDGKLVRCEIDPKEYYYDSSELFEADLFFSNIKRLKADKTNEKLVQLFQTFGRPLPLI